MPKIEFEGQTWEVPEGTKLRDALHKAGATPHNGQTRWFNCKGFGSCGTCAIKIEGTVSPKTAMERWRLRFPPHREEDGLRLACQVRVEHDIKVTKYNGFWGHHTHQPPRNS